MVLKKHVKEVENLNLVRFERIREFTTFLDDDHTLKKGTYKTRHLAAEKRYKRRFYQL